MRGMRILHTADLHLRAAGDERWEALAAVLDQAESLDVDLVVISGDMFDKNVEAQRLKPALREVFAARPIPVVILPGNHDEKGLRAGDFFHERVTVLADRTRPIDFEDVRIVGIPFEDAGADRVLERLLEARRLLRDGVTNVLLFHGELLDLIPEPDAFGEDEGRDYMPVRLSAFSQLGFEYVLAGHFHRNFDVRRFEGGYFVYPGSPVSITRRETGRRHAVLVEIGQAPQPVALDTRHYEEVTVTLNPFDGRNPLDEIRARIESVHPKAVVRLSLEGFVNAESLGMTETAFGAEVQALVSGAHVADVEQRWRDVSEILEHELFRRFLARLEAGQLPDEERARVREMMMDALMETIHAD